MTETNFLGKLLKEINSKFNLAKPHFVNYSSIYTSALLLEQKFIVSFPVLTTEKGGPLNQTVELLAKRNGKPERIIQ